MTGTWVWVDGVVTPVHESVVPASDRGLLLGEGVYETLVVPSGERPFALRRHLARLRRSAERCGIEVPWDDDALRAACGAVVSAAVSSGGPGTPRRLQRLRRLRRLRITVTGGDGTLGPDASAGDRRPRLLVSVAELVAWPATTAVVGVPWRLNEWSPIAGAKSTSRLELGRSLDAANAAGADEAVLCNTGGALAEGTGSNVFLVVDDALVTPSLDTGCLAGVTRELVIEELAAAGVAVEERSDLRFSDLLDSSEAFLTSATRGVHPVATVDGRKLLATPGPHTERAGAALRRVEERTDDP